MQLGFPLLLLFLVLLFAFLYLTSKDSEPKPTSEPNTTSETTSTSDESSSTTDGSTSTTATSVTINDIAYTTSEVTNNLTYFWKVVASDPKGGSAESATWNFIVQ